MHLAMTVWAQCCWINDAVIAAFGKPYDVVAFEVGFILSVHEWRRLRAELAFPIGAPPCVFGHVLVTDIGE